MGQIKVERISDEKRKKLGIPDTCKEQGEWSVWECEPSSFDWHYDSEELAYVYEGQVKVTTDKEDVEIQSGDFVIFPAGLSCHWQILKKIRKVYTFR